jgi:hypothetical protein
VSETCVHFATGPEFAPVLLRQRDHARERDHTRLAAVYNQLLDRIESDNNTTPAYAGEHTHLTGSPA